MRALRAHLFEHFLFAYIVKLFFIEKKHLNFVRIIDLPKTFRNNEHFLSNYEQEVNDISKEIYICTIHQMQEKFVNSKEMLVIS